MRISVYAGMLRGGERVKAGEDVEMVVVVHDKSSTGWAGEDQKEKSEV